MNIVLTGMRGSGKTSIGKLLHQKLQLPFIDLDHYIEEKAGKKIAEIVAESGWDTFRALEGEAAAAVGALDGHIIASGGGTIINPANYEALKQNALIVFLEEDLEECLYWIRNDKNRPPLTSEKDQLEELKKVYAERRDIYHSTADIILQRSKDIEADADKLISTIS